MAAGCNRIIYESVQLANIMTDQSLQDDLIGIILEPDNVTLETKGNGVHVRYAPTTVEVLKQVKPEDTAVNNEATLSATLEAAKLFVFTLIRSHDFQKVPSVPAVKITERRYDANVIGWSLTLDLQPITNSLSC
jgi:hypothetical protein